MKKIFACLLAAVLSGCTTAPKKNQTVAAPALSAAPAAVFPQDFPPMDVQHDLTSYQASFSAEKNRTRPILFIVGDSTVHNQTRDLVGWGDVIGGYFDTNKIIVENHALAGRSSRTFQTQGWWNLVLSAARPGDFVLIQMGHNDSSPINDHTRSRGSLPGLGNESTNLINGLTGQPETVHTYGWYMRKFISDARAKGMLPIICTAVSRLPRPGKELDTTRYAAWARELAKEENVPLIDLNRLVLNHYAGMTTEQIQKNYFARGESTHFNLAGAQLNAACVVEGLHESKNCPLKNFLLEKTN